MNKGVVEFSSHYAIPRKCLIGKYFNFEQSNDPRHTANAANIHLDKNVVMDWPPQRADPSLGSFGDNLDTETKGSQYLKKGFGMSFKNS